MGTRSAYDLIQEKIKPIAHEDSVIALEIEPILESTKECYDTPHTSFHTIDKWNVLNYMNNRTKVEKEITAFNTQWSLLQVFHQSLDVIRDKLKNKKDLVTRKERILCPTPFPLVVQTSPSPLLEPNAVGAFDK